LEAIIKDKIRITVLGANGQLGQEFQYLAKTIDNISFTFFDKNSLDITSLSALKSMVEETKPDYLINCAAYTAVDKAESDQETCFAINRDACSLLVEVLENKKISLVHFSTDYVYNHFKRFPLRESDYKNPSGAYAISKLEGENILRNAAIEALIIRTSWVVSSYGHNFVKTMMILGAEKAEINVVNDQFGVPTYARHLAIAVIEIINQVEKDDALIPAFNDTYNFTNEGIITWYDLANQVMKLSNSDCIVHPIPSSAYPTPAQRPKWSLLSKHKMKDIFKLEIPHWLTAINECILEINQTRSN
jgi:dTDP-4-dehydrorhamnose reductase